MRFLKDAHDARIDPDLPVVQVRNRSDLGKVVAGLNAATEGSGVQLISVDGFDAWTSFRKDHKYVRAAGGLVDDGTGRLLVIRRLGTWDLPKGKVERGEGVSEAAVREVREECGLGAVSLVKPLISTWHTYERKGVQHLKRTDWFLMRASSLEPLKAQVEEGIEAVRWMDPRELTAMEKDTYPSLLPVLRIWKGLGDKAGISRPRP